MHSPWLSIITVVKDAPDDFVSTLSSVRAQDTAGVEFIVVDSSSDPGALPALLRDVTDIPHRYRWLDPTGVYPAMNAGLEMATGEYAYFLNAGDILLAPTSLSEVKSIIESRRPQWLFADVEMTDAKGGVLVTPDWDYDAEQRAGFSRGHFPCHQGTFVRAAELRSLGGFNTDYRIVADYEMFLRLSQRARPARLKQPVARFQPGGLSSQHWREASAEFHQARRAVLRPTGSRAARELWETWRLFAATAVYRALWAPGRPAHGVMARLRGR